MFSAEPTPSTLHTPCLHQSFAFQRVRRSRVDQTIVVQKARHSQGWGWGQPTGCAISRGKCQVTLPLSTFEFLVFARYCCRLTSERRRCFMRFRLIRFCSPKCFRRQLLNHPRHVPRHVARRLCSCLSNVTEGQCQHVSRIRGISPWPLRFTRASWFSSLRAQIFEAMIGQ